MKAPKYLLAKYCIAFVLLNLIYFSATAQYYPVPPRPDPSERDMLLAQIHAARHDETEIHALLQLSCIYYHYPRKQRSDLDRAFFFAEQAEALSMRLHDKTGINNARFYKGEVFITEKNIPAAAILLDQLDDTTRLKLLLNLSNFNGFNTDEVPEHMNRAADFAQQSLTLATRLGRKAEENEAMLNIASIDLEKDEPDYCEKLLKKIIGDSSSTQYELLRYAYLTYSSLGCSKGNYDKAMNYSLKALGTITNPADSLQAGDCYFEQAYTYYLTENNIRAFEFCQKAIAAYSIYPGEASIVDAINFATVSLTKLNQYRRAERFLAEMNSRYPPQNESDKVTYLNAWGYLYKGEKKYAQAEPYFLQVLKISVASHLEEEGIYRNMGDLLVQDHKYTQAKPFLVKALNFPGGKPSLRNQELVHYYLFLCDSAARDYVTAIRELSLSEFLDNKIKDVDKTTQFQNLEVQYETKEKEKKLKIEGQDILLLQRTNQIQQANLNRSRLVRKFAFAGLGILLVLLIVSVAYYRQKQKVNRVITLKNLTITRQNVHLQQLLIDKDWLLKEVNHRVKNNLQTIICLLESQAIYLENDALKAIEISQHRIYAMSLIHQKIYQSEDVSTINMASYLPDLIRYLKESFGSPDHIQFQADIESLKLDVSQAIPIALIVNEALTNSIKYAFPEARPGVIKVALTKHEEFVRLNVQDNGIGMPRDITSDKPASLGLSLIKGLTDDLKGTVQFLTESGTTVIVLFQRVFFT
jgi:two-component system, sensor histidine kinase PdtaS